MGEVLVLRENREKTVLDTWTEVLKPQSEERTDVDIHSYFLSSVYWNQSGIRDKKRKMHFRCVKPEKYRGVAQLVARGIWDAEVADSSSVAPTIKSIWRMVDVWWNSLKADYILAGLYCISANEAWFYQTRVVIVLVLENNGVWLSLARAWHLGC